MRMQASLGTGRYLHSPPDVNGGMEFVENGVRDPAVADVYDLIEKAEVALSLKIAESDQLRGALEKAQHQLQLLGRKPVLEEPQAKLIANGNVEHKGEDVKVDGLHQSPPSSPSRRNLEERPRKEEMMLTRSQEEAHNRDLRSSLIHAALRESQLVAEISSLECKLAELQMLYHREQQNLADATAKALAFREELVDKNMKLAYENQALGQERNIFVSSLLPLLEEFDFPPTTDAQAIVTSVKAMVQYLRDRINSERKSKESGYYRPWHVYASPSPRAMPSPPRFVSSPSPISNGQGLEIVPQNMYPHAQRPASPPSPLNVNTVLRQTELVPPLSKNMNTELHENGYTEQDDGGYIPAMDYVKRSPHLPTLPEEPNHAASEDDDPLPAVSGLRIVGDAVLGSKLTVCGHSINGTALCNFQWIRYYPDGTFEDIEGASQTEYTLNADDCDTFIAIQCCPMDERGRKGNQEIQFANSQNLIKCDQTLEDQINTHVISSQAHFDVMIMMEGGDGEPGTLLLKRSSYEIKRNGVRIVKESYSPDMNARVVLGQGILCAITCGDGGEHHLSFKENRVRDRAVLALRRFRQLALEGKKVKGKTWFGKHRS